MNLHSTADAARILGKSKPTITRAHAEHGIGQRVGAALVFTDADIEKLRKLLRDGPGNPGFVTGNRFGKPPKKKRRK